VCLSSIGGHKRPDLCQILIEVILEVKNVLISQV